MKTKKLQQTARTRGVLAVMCYLLVGIPSAQSADDTVTVTAYPLWTDTGIILKTEDSIRIHDAVGRWTINRDHVGEDFGPEGIPFPAVVHFNLWLTDGRFGDLIGFIGESPYNADQHVPLIPQNDPGLFAIGTNSVSLTGKSGKLWLGFNDAYVTGWWDNDGSVSVQVDVRESVDFDFVVSVPGAIASNDGELPFCSEDVLSCKVSSPVEDSSIVHWTAVTSDGIPSSDEGYGATFDTGFDHLSRWPAYIPSWPDRPYRPRPLLTCTVTAELIDPNGVVVAKKTRIVAQSDLGQLRQEYVDLPVNPLFDVGDVPPPVERFVDGHTQLNSGDYPNWALIPIWAVDAAATVLANAGMSVPAIPTQINSCYRNPVHDGNVQLRNISLGRTTRRDVSFRNLHIWGAAIDFHSDATTYCALAAVCMPQGDVVWEHTTTHVHVQQYGHQQPLPHCRR